jgi:hypothetical protein
MHATNLFAASYSGMVTTLQLTHSHLGNYSLDAIASSKACTPAPSWFALDSHRGVLYCSGVAADSTGTIHSLAIEANGSLTALDEVPTAGGAAASAIYGHGEALGLLICTSLPFLSITNSDWKTTEWLCGSGIGAAGGTIGTHSIRNSTNLTTIQTSTLTISAPGPNPTQNMAHADEVILIRVGSL